MEIDDPTRNPAGDRAYTPQEIVDLLVAGAEHHGAPHMRAAIHLLTYTPLVHNPHIRTFLNFTDSYGPGGKVVPVAVVADWPALVNGEAAKFAGGAGYRMATLAAALATGMPINLQDALSGLGRYSGRRVTEAFLMILEPHKRHTRSREARS